MPVEWDEEKNRQNQLSHDLSFEEAQQLLSSEADYLELFDEAHSAQEERFISIGPIARGLIIVVWTERDEDTIRIISARFATKRERALYHTHLERYQ